MSFQIELRSSFASDSPRLVLCIFSSSCSDVPFIMSFNKLVNVEKKKKRVPLDYKNVAHLILRAEPSCLPACNKSISCLSLCLSLNSFYAEAQST